MKKTTAYFLNRFYLKNHSLLIISGTALGGFLASKFFLYCDIQSPSLRYTLSALTGYVVFLFLMYIWMKYLKDQLMINDRLMLNRNLSESDGEPTQEKPNALANIADGVSAVDIPGDDTLGLIITIITIIILLFFSVSFIIELPVIIIELLLSAMTASIFNANIRRFDENIFVFSLIKNTLLKALMIIFIYFLIGIALEQICPGSIKITDLFTSGCIK